MAKRKATEAKHNSAMLDDLTDFFHFHISRGGWTRVALVLGDGTGRFVNLWPSDNPDVPWDEVWVRSRLRMLLGGGYLPLAWVFRATPQRAEEVPEGFFDTTGLFGLGLPQLSVCGVSVKPFLERGKPWVERFTQCVLEEHAKNFLKDIGLGDAPTQIATKEQNKHRER